MTIEPQCGDPTNDPITNTRATPILDPIGDNIIPITDIPIVEPIKAPSIVHILQPISNLDVLKRGSQEQEV